MALPLSLILLVGLGLVATAAVFLSNTEMRISSSYGTSNRAVSVAEAAVEHGVAELNSRIRAGENPDSVQIVASTLGSFSYTVSAYSKRERMVGASGRDLNGDGDMSDVVLYDRSFGYARANATGAAGNQGYPVKLLVGVATDGKSRAQLQAEVARDLLDPKLEAAFSLNAASNAALTGNFGVDGRLYDRSGKLVASSSLTPAYGKDASSKTAAKNDCNYWKAGLRIPAEGSLQLEGNVDSYGHTAFDHDAVADRNYDNEDSLATFKFTPEEILGVQPGTLDGYKKDASAVPDYTKLSGVNYVVSGEVPSQISGSGILIIHNPRYDVRKYDCANFPATCDQGYRLDPANQPLTLKINASGSFNGIIIVDSLVKLSGNFTMLGGIATLSTETSDIPANGSGYVRWSCQAMTDAAAQASGYDTRLSWEHRLP